MKGQTAPGPNHVFAGKPLALRFISDLLSPRSWLIVAAVFLLGWAAVGYHQSQLKAALLLDQGRGDPASFDPLRRSLLGVTFLMIAMAALSSLELWGRLLPSLRNRSARPASEPKNTDMFQPIRSQEELATESGDPTTARRTSVPRVVSRLILGPEDRSKP